MIRKNGRLNIITIAIASIFEMMSMVACAEDIVCSAAQDSSVNGVKKGQLFLYRDTRLAGVRARHESELMRYPNVVGVAEGVLIKQGKPSNDPCLVVYVTKKDVGGEKANKAGALPCEIEGIPIHIVDVGKIEPLLR